MCSKSSGISVMLSILLRKQALHREAHSGLIQYDRVCNDGDWYSNRVIRSYYIRRIHMSISNSPIRNIGNQDAKLFYSSQPLSILGLAHLEIPFSNCSHLQVPQLVKPLLCQCWKREWPHLQKSLGILVICQNTPSRLGCNRARVWILLLLCWWC